MDEATLLWGFLFGTIGIAMAVYGRKKKNGSDGLRCDAGGFPLRGH